MVSTKADPGDTKEEDTLIKQLENLCTSNLLSITTLREKTNNISPTTVLDAIANSDYLLHAICKNDNISNSIVEHMLRLCPTAVSKPIRDGQMYPLHLAAANPHCSGSVIKLLVKMDASILEKRVTADVSIQVVSSKLFPLHYYILRRSNYDYGVLEFLVKSYPEALTYLPDREDRDYYYITPLKLLCKEGKEISLDLVKLLAGTNNECLELRKSGLDCPPFMALLGNSNIKPFPLEVVRYFIRFGTQGILGSKHIFNGNVLHAACSNQNITLEALQFLLECSDYTETSSDALVRMSLGTSSKKDLPIHILCQNKELDEETSVAILKVLVDLYPESVQQCGNDGYLPIHYACVNKSFEFCKYLIEKYSECTASITCGQELQTLFHLACANGSLQLVKYLYELRPSSIHVQTYDKDYDKDDDGEYLDWTEYSNLPRGYYALHLAVLNQHADRKDIVRFILEKDSRAASRVGTWGRLPLHQACASNMNLDIVKDIFKANPSAIHTKDMFDRFPIHYACGCAELRRNTFGGYELLPSSKRQTSLVIEFLVEQLPYSLGAQDLQGRNCAHYASASSLAMKKISLIEKKCPESFKVYSDDHGFPIHYACTHGADVEVVGHLVLMLPGSIQVEHPLLGSPIACARDLGSFVLLLRLYRKCFGKSARGTRAFHAILHDDTIEVKYQIITRFIEFSQESRTEDFQDDVRTKDKETGTLPLHLIFGGRNFRTLDSDDPEIQSFLLETNVELLKDLIDCYPRALEEVDNRGWLPLHHAVRHNAPLKMIQLLLERYPLGIQVADKQGSTPLHIACRYGALKPVIRHLLIQCNSSLLSVDNNGFTPLHVACKHRAPLPLALPLNLAEEFSECCLMQDNRGELPLHKACRGGHLHLIKEIIDMQPASVSVRNNQNELPIFILCKRSGKDKEVRESVEYTETIWKLLLAHPETVSV